MSLSFQGGFASPTIHGSSVQNRTCVGWRMPSVGQPILAAAVFLRGVRPAESRLQTESLPHKLRESITCKEGRETKWH